MGMTAHNLRRRVQAEAEAKRKAASYKAAPPRNLAAELEEERVKSARLERELEEERAAAAELEEQLTEPKPKRAEPSDPVIPLTTEPPTRPEARQPTQSQQRPQGRGGRG